jgi:cell division protein FtsB
MAQNNNRWAGAARRAFGGRSLATGAAVILALVFGWHAVFGQNGITAYAQKRGEDRALKSQIQKLSDENAKLKHHVDHLQSDPDTIEVEARQRLHYTRSGEVIYTLNDPPKADSTSRDTSK